MIDAWKGVKRGSGYAWLDNIADSMDVNLNKLQEILMDREIWPCCSPWGRKELDMT